MIARILAALALGALVVVSAPAHAAEHPWPKRERYIQAMHNMSSYVTDRSLRGASVSKDKYKQPINFSGTFSTVFKVRTPGGHRIALRVFHPLKEAEERADLAAFGKRYNALTTYVRDLRAQGHVIPEIVDFAFVPEGITIDGQKLPILKLPWLEGRSLDDFIGRRLRQRHTKALGITADNLRAALKQMRSHGLAHGDLHPGNILINKAGFINLMDYDSMYAPPLAGLDNAEIGVEHFQHPQFHFANVWTAGQPPLARPRSGPAKAQRPFDVNMDNFSSIVIYLSLKAVEADPSLWAKYNTEDSGRLLFEGKRDFLHPESSPLLADLRRSPSREVRQLAASLARYVKGPAANVPSLEQVLNTSNTPWYAQQAGAAAAPPSPPPVRTIVPGLPPAPATARPARSAGGTPWYAKGTP